MTVIKFTALCVMQRAQQDKKLVDLDSFDKSIVQLMERGVERMRLLNIGAPLSESTNFKIFQYSKKT
jgi:hypothetical protein